VKVTAIPPENTTDKRKALFVSFAPVPPTYAITSGTLDREQGVKEVSIPASNAKKGASHIFAVIVDDKISSHCIIMEAITAYPFLPI
jgi:hypothetical protein